MTYPNTVCMVLEPDDVDGGDDVIASEGRRRLNLIESRSDRYQRQAALVLRISLATIGVIAAFGDPQFLTNFLSLLIENIDPASTVEKLSTGVTNTNPLFAILLVFALSFQGAMGAILTVTFTLSAILAAGLVVYPQHDDLPTGIRSLSDYGNRRDRPAKCLLSHYDDLISLNTAALEEKRDYLKATYISLVIAVIGGIALIYSVSILGFAGPEETITAGSVSIGVLLIGVSSVFIWARSNTAYRPLLSWSHETETGLFLAIATTTLLLYLPILRFQIVGIPVVALLPLILPLRGFWRSEEERMRLGMKGMVWHMFLLGSLGGIILVYPGDITSIIPVDLIIVVFFASFYPAVFMVELLAISIISISMEILRIRNPSLHRRILSLIPQRLDRSL